eukprot:gene2623-3820_t
MKSDLPVYRSTTILKETKIYNPVKEEIEKLSKDLNLSITSEEFSFELNSRDELKEFEKEFHKPKDGLYFTGNSLGLQPKTVQDKMFNELEKWKKIGVRGHFEGEYPWFKIEEYAIPSLSKLLGCKENEVAISSTLTTNLHLLMTSFYQPTSKRFKLLIEESPFPSDMMAFLSQIKLHGLNPEEVLIQIGPRENENYIHTEDILEIIEKEGDEICLILFSGVHFLSGQAFEIEKITKKGHEKGCFVGFDLAHATGNLELKLNEWNVDFGCFCTYKYLNSGPGSIGGLFLHEQHHDKDFKRFQGWWGNKRENRFSMKTYFDGQKGAGIYQLSNPSIFSIIPLLSSLEIFDKTSISKLRYKSERLTSYLEILINHELFDQLEILTPKSLHLRGCQLSLKIKNFNGNLDEFINILENENIDIDKRDPNILRISPVPLYNNFNEIWKLIKILKNLLT